MLSQRTGFPNNTFFRNFSSSERGKTFEARTMRFAAEDISAIELRKYTEQIRQEFVRTIQSIENRETKDEDALIDFSLAVARLSVQSAYATLPGMTHGSALLRAESQRGKDELKSAFDDAFSSERLAEVIKVASAQKVSDGDERFRTLLIDSFKRKGCGNARRDLVCENFREIERRCSEFASTINEDRTFVLYDEEELTGVPDLKQYERFDDGKVKVTLKAPDVMPVLQFCANAKAREKLARAKNTQCQEKNTKLFLETVKLRHETANLLGYENHASYMLEPKMAKTPANAIQFLEDILNRSQSRLKKDLEILLELKRKEEGNDVNKIEPWDIAYYTRAYKATLGVDEAEIRNYFPLEHTRDAILSTYEKLLNVTFKKEIEAEVWHDEVECYAVYENENNSTPAGFFYLDLYPREGKYSHQCVYPLRPSFVDNDGKVVPPACVNIGNLSRSTDPTKPSLLRFREVETFFHEFGHVMHCVLSKSKHSMQAWAWSAVPWPGGVEQDFLEVPSMMLENFVWRREVLETLSKHIETGDALPRKTIENLSKSRFVMDGLNRCRFIAMAMYDLKIHSSAGPLYEFNGEKDLNAIDLYNEMTKSMSGIDYIEGAFPVASWFHPMMGYDAGYYGYLWSEAFAADLFAEFENSKHGVLDASLGKKYRECILAPCATLDGNTMLENFLNRKPSLDAFVTRMNSSS